MLALQLRCLPKLLLQIPPLQEKMKRKVDSVTSAPRGTAAPGARSAFVSGCVGKNLLQLLEVHRVQAELLWLQYDLLLAQSQLRWDGIPRALERGDAVRVALRAPRGLAICHPRGGNLDLGRSQSTNAQAKNSEGCCSPEVAGSYGTTVSGEPLSPPARPFPLQVASTVCVFKS